VAALLRDFPRAISPTEIPRPYRNTQSIVGRAGPGTTGHSRAEPERVEQGRIGYRTGQSRAGWRTGHVTHAAERAISPRRDVRGCTAPDAPSSPPAAVHPAFPRPTVLLYYRLGYSRWSSCIPLVSPRTGQDSILGVQNRADLVQ
jgi:hypothetical protein